MCRLKNIVSLRNNSGWIASFAKHRSNNQVLNAIKEIIKPDGIVFISEPSNTVLLALWLFFINNTPLEVVCLFKKLHDLHVEEKRPTKTI